MRIPHLIQSTRSQFHGLVHTALADALRPLNLDVNLRSGGGYDGEIQVKIQAPDELEFEAALELRDWTRFPARIRAAATALRDRGLLGRFRIGHQDGQLTIHEF
jgi:hypothetical protein